MNTNAKSRNADSKPHVTDNSLSKYVTSFGISLGLTSLFNGLLVVVKETNEETVLAWMKAATGHHWVTQGILDLALFVILGFALANVAERWRFRPDAVITAVVGGVVLGGLIVAGFYI